MTSSSFLSAVMCLDSTNARITWLSFGYHVISAALGGWFGADWSLYRSLSFLYLFSSCCSDLIYDSSGRCDVILWLMISWWVILSIWYRAAGDYFSAQQDILFHLFLFKPSVTARYWSRDVPLDRTARSRDSSLVFSHVTRIIHYKLL